MKNEWNETRALQAYSADAYLVVNKELLMAFGPVKAIYLSNLIDKMLYFKKKHPGGDGFFYMLVEQQRKHTGIADDLLRRCQSFFERLGVLEIERRGIPARNWYHIKVEQLFDILSAQDEEALDPAHSGIQIPLTAGSRPRSQPDLIKETKLKETKLKDIKLHSLASGTRRASAGLKNKEYAPLVTRLWQVIASRKKVNSTAKPRDWADTLRKIVEVDGYDKTRLEAVIDWLDKNPGAHEMPYCPIIESARSLRDKFEKMERFIAKRGEAPAKRQISGRRVAKDGVRILA